MVKTFLGGILVVLAMTLAWCAITSVVLMVCWNQVSYMFDLPKVNLVQAFCLMVCSTLLFKSSKDASQKSS